MTAPVLSPAERTAMDAARPQIALTQDEWYEAGWFACREWMEERERVLREALEFYAAGIGFSEREDDGATAREALAALVSPTPQETPR